MTSWLAACSVLVLVVMLLVACGSPVSSGNAHPTATPARITATATPPSAPTSVIVVRLGGIGQETHVAPFQMTTQDSARVTQLYQATYALSRYSRGAFGCAQDQGVGYELSFLHGDTLVLQAVMDDACKSVLLSSGPGLPCPDLTRDWTPAFTAQIAAALAVPTATIEPPNGLYNTAGPNDPLAQGAPTPPVIVPKHC